MEIERKYLIDASNIPINLQQYPHRTIEQGYLFTKPVLRIRKDGEHYELTYKSSGLMSREEYTLPLNKESYEQLLPKVSGHMIHKIRYVIPFQDNLAIELDVFSGLHKPLIIAEIEFPDQLTAERVIVPAWFGEEVTFSGKYHNSYLAQHGYSPSS